MKNERAQDVISSFLKKAVDNRALNLEHKTDIAKKEKTWVGKSPENLGKQPKTDKYKNIDRTTLSNIEPKASKVLNDFFKVAEDDSDINGSTGACLEVALKGGPIDMDRARGLHSNKAVSETPIIDFLTSRASEEMKSEDPCWEGYEMVGKKMKNGKEVPNCVPKSKKAHQLLKEALNPGGIPMGGAGDGVVGKKPALPSGRRDEAPAPAKIPGQKSTFDFNKLYPNLAEKPAKAPTPKTPGTTSIKDDFMAGPMGQAGKVLKDYFNTTPGKHEAPKPKHQGPGFAQQIGDKVKSVVDNVKSQVAPGKHNQPSGNHVQKFVDYLKNLVPKQNTTQPNSSPQVAPQTAPSSPKMSEPSMATQPPAVEKQNPVFPTPGADSAHSSSNPATDRRLQKQQEDYQRAVENGTAQTGNEPNNATQEKMQYMQDNAQRALERQQQLEKEHGLTPAAAKEVVELVKTALNETEDYAQIITALNEMGYPTKGIIKAFG